MPVLDLTLPVTSGMRSSPGEPRGYFLPFADLDDAAGFTAHQLMLYSHLGTHMDAPSHFLEGGKTIEQVPLTQVIGPAMVAAATLRSGTTELTEEDLELPEPLAPGARLLLFTGWDRHWGTSHYFHGFPNVSERLARFLADHQVGLLGMDTPTPHETRPREVHEILLQAGVAIVEGLTGLSAIAGTTGELLCTPLPLVGVDGSPVRAVWRTEARR